MQVRPNVVWCGGSGVSKWLVWHLLYRKNSPVRTPSTANDRTDGNDNIDYKSRAVLDRYRTARSVASATDARSLHLRPADWVATARPNRRPPAWIVDAHDTSLGGREGCERASVRSAGAFGAKLLSDQPSRNKFSYFSTFR